MSLTEYREQIRHENISFRQGLPRDERDPRNDGTFFSPLESICDLVRLGVAASKFPNIQRDKAEGERIYSNTANAQYLENCSEATSEKSDTTKLCKSSRWWIFFSTWKEEKHIL